MIPRRKAAGAPSWMVTFADMMSLLLALFVLLLSFSVMDAQRYKQIAGSMRDAFGLQQFHRLAGVIEVQGNPARNQVRESQPVPLATVPLPTAPETVLPDRETLDAIEAETAQRRKDETSGNEGGPAHPMLWRLRYDLAREVSDSRLSIEARDRLIVISFPDTVAFPSGQARLSAPFLPVLDKLARILEETEGDILIAGHTDSMPIATSRFRSNWDLSAARAVSVVHYWLANSALPPSRLTAQGHADSRPVIIDETPQTSAVNRRVEISIALQ